MDQDHIEKTVVRAGCRTEAKAAALERLIHNGGKIYFFIGLRFSVQRKGEGEGTEGK